MNSEELQSALAAVQSLQPPQPPLEAPAHLRGLLARAADAAPAGPVRSIVFRTPDAPGVSRPLRSSPAFLAGFCGELQGSRSDAEFGEAVTALRERLLATGAYKGVGAALDPGAPGAAPNLVITLDEMSYSANAGAMGGVRGGGSVTAGATLSLINALGYAESLNLSLGNDVPMAFGVGGNDGASALGSLLSGGAQGAGALSHLPFGGAAPAAAARLALPRAPQPNWKLEARKPTLAGTAASLGLVLRQDTGPLETHSSLTHKLLEGEASFTDATGCHSVALATALRQLSPLRPAHSPTATLSSPETLSHCLASVKNSLTYAARLGPGLAPSEAVPASGARAVARVEVAGLGGDVSFLKLAASGTWAASWGRYTPDTGYQLPRGSGGSGGLQPFPGAAGLLPWCSRSGPRPSALSERLAAWLSPGVTLALDGFLGYLQPLGRGVSGGATPSSATHLCDRFFLPSNGRAMRGFYSLGLRGSLPVGGAGVGGGSSSRSSSAWAGDGLGGDALACVTARLLLPPPLPVFSMVEAGARTYVWGSLGASALHGSGALASPRDTLQRLLQRPSASMGVGVTLPISSVAVNLEYSIATPLVAAGDSPCSALRLGLTV